MKLASSKNLVSSSQEIGETCNARRLHVPFYSSKLSYHLSRMIKMIITDKC
jgi:hypothetical protein